VTKGGTFDPARSLPLEPTRRSVTALTGDRQLAFRRICGFAIGHQLAVETERHITGPVCQQCNGGGRHSAHSEDVVDDRRGLFERTPMRDLLVAKILDRYAAVVISTPRPLRDGVLQRGRIADLLDRGLHVLILQQVENILRMEVARPRWRVRASDHAHQPGPQRPIDAHGHVIDPCRIDCRHHLLDRED
jgi:hypothetical protein